MGDIDAQARALYERNTLCAPAWDNLGDITRGVWRDDVLARAGTPATPCTPTPPPVPETTGQASLF